VGRRVHGGATKIVEQVINRLDKAGNTAIRAYKAPSDIGSTNCVAFALRFHSITSCKKTKSPVNATPPPTLTAGVEVE
jgi:hypothetical protein